MTEPRTYPWQTYWDRPPMDVRTPLTVRGDRVYGHIAGPDPLHGRPVALEHFLTAGLRPTASGVRVPTGVLTAAGRPAAQVTAWLDRFGVACSGRLLQPPWVTASARLNGADPWPRWRIVSGAAHLVAVEFDTSQRESLTRTEQLAPARQRAALARIAALRQQHALQRIDSARRRHR